MPIHLTPPAYNPSGPDGQGWNRLSIGWQPGAQCALRPRDWPTLFESRDTRRARWGGFGPCVRDGGDCGACPVLDRLKADRFTLDPEVIGDEVLVLVDDDGTARVPTGKGYFRPTAWTDLARLSGWKLGRRHPEGFWLVRVP
ncbi:hypothetical protein PV387_03590 [Streptomyces sp. ME02-6987-2C]|uniref:hypothetical protein n=1 Tax=unclassified Streptomyces TaxID=2593676 RepID=UPI0029BD54B4|nr:MULTISPECIES: hypothetical protein [unclassified Streptomyces]MDX3345924.1 hypothetical protein [Streptomyces sp. ME02-6979A]MDX3365118.1 hypothetical protein [Streptomyces sp. ME02-6987-2C]MDX3404826.1 hypothetical protein [Streptomyces sp. ME02-6977A]MDX3421690.1 hypothetical protein [Streptomyces sp. ME02-6985-2c]